MQSMRRGLCALAGIAALSLSGCVGFTDYATHVTQTSAWLEAHGRTDDYPAKFYFRYANYEADLPTAAAHRTPTRTVPAHRPESGNYGYFHEGVSDLSPGRVWYYELCGADDRPGAPEMCGGRQHFFTDSASGQDRIEVTLTDPASIWYLHRIKAASGPQGQHPDGLVDFLAKNWWDGEARVTCMKMETINYTTRVAIGVVGVNGKQPGGPERRYSALYTISKTLFEPNRYQIREQASPDCEHADFTNQIEFHGSFLFENEP
jgi:hypothetical protein